MEDVCGSPNRGPLAPRSGDDGERSWIPEGARRRGPCARMRGVSAGSGPVHVRLSRRDCRPSAAGAKHGHAEEAAACASGRSAAAGRSTGAEPRSELSGTDESPLTHRPHARPCAGVGGLTPPMSAQRTGGRTGCRRCPKARSIRAGSRLPNAIADAVSRSRSASANAAAIVRNSLLKTRSTRSAGRSSTASASSCVYDRRRHLPTRQPVD